MERSKFLGLRYASHETCLTEMIDLVKVDSSSVAAFGLHSGAVEGKPEVHNITNYMLSRWCGQGANLPSQCPAPVGSKNAVYRVMKEKPAEFDRVMKIFFTKQNDKEIQWRARGQRCLHSRW